MISQALERRSTARSGLVSVVCAERKAISWGLVIGILLVLFACGLHHGQMSGLALSGLNSGFCSLVSGSDISPDPGGSDQTQDSVAQLSCPLCSSFTAAIASHYAASAFYSLAGASSVPVFVRSWPQPPPRYLWPSLSPRASPR
ncbi:DUF2946 domain-containing protein [Pseudomonas sp. SL4(2022)]|uniref:DUF2946 domain-containing protein n=1 Tax=Pseudomonas sp. SL4(2022) TaxID=2994661 RepID=UPI00226F66E5|nr:DUF2946 domain-containing protein [Pseudomonas sp. SL4(2022)]WAC45266.1 DUF2946 domain-containing protein [Pseudomonas sp. SL4(2022)]